MSLEKIRIDRLRLLILVLLSTTLLSTAQQSLADEAVYQAFNLFARDNFGAERDSLVYDAFGSQLQFKDSGFWIHESRNSSAIAFETNLPATTRVEFGTTSAYGQSTAQSERPFYLHLHHVTGLQANTVYHYRFVAVDERGNQITSADRTFQTQPLSQAISVPGSLQGPPYVLSQDNATYILTQDIDSNTRGITVQGANITLDLNGHTITYDKGTPAVQGDWSVYLNSSVSTAGIAGGGNAKILNGRIKQGANNGTGDIGIGFNPIMNSSSSALEVAGIAAEWAGDSVSGLEKHWGALHAHHNKLTDKGTGIANRHQGLKAIYSGTGSASGIHHNLIARARHQGVMVGDATGRIFSNEIAEDSWATNAFGIGGNQLVRDNKLFGTGYHVVGIGWANGMTVEDNLVYLQCVAPTNRSEESGLHSSANGIRLTQYNGSTVLYENNLYRGNTVIVKARGGCTVSRAVQVASDPYIKNVRFTNNTIKCETQDGGTAVVPCIVGQGATNGDGSSRDPQAQPVYYENNRLISNSVNVRLGDSYGMAGNHQFRSNTLERFGARSDYNTVEIGYWVWNSTRNRFIDSIMLGGASLDDHQFNGSGNRDYAVGHSLYVMARGAEGEPLVNQSVLVQDSTGADYLGTTDAQGVVRLELIEYMWKGQPSGPPAKLDRTGHRLEVAGFEPYTVTPTLFAIRDNSFDPVSIQFTPIGQQPDTLAPAAPGRLGVM